MTTQVLICDDSSFARKQVAKSLPEAWDVAVSFAVDGKEGLAAVQAGSADVMFLDLNMPEMDGYAVLEAMRGHEYPTVTIVISGDVQSRAVKRVKELGALEFIKKPVFKTELETVLKKYGLLGESAVNSAEVSAVVTEAGSDNPVPAMDYQDSFQEVCNVAMGRAADLLAQLLDVFVEMPIPRVNTIEVSELHMAIQQVSVNNTVSAVCQGFIGAGIAGEALVMFDDTSFKDIAKLLKYDGELDETIEVELLMDTASILNGACLKGIADQLDINFSQGHPMVLGQHVQIDSLIQRNARRWQKTLCVELGYRIEGYNIRCDLILLFTEDSLQPLSELLAYLAEE